MTWSDGTTSSRRGTFTVSNKGATTPSTPPTPTATPTKTPADPPTTTAPPAPKPTVTTAPPTTAAPAPTQSTTVPPAPNGSWPSAPPAKICGNASVLNGPATAPAGAITVPAGDNGSLDLGQAGKTYWFAPGIHTLGTGMYDQIIPSDNSTYIGGPGAILDGQGKNNYAFTQHARNVTIKYLTIKNFVAPMNEGTVNHDSGENWTMQYNTVTNNGGAGIFVGAGNVASYNCLKDNSQYGFQGYGPDGGESNIVLDHNEIVGNNTGNWEAKMDGCGCTGGGKFWDVRNVRVTNNYVHDNKSVGLWADTNDNNFLFEGNWIENNDGQAIFWEISYNAAIRNNVIRHNLVADGPGTDQVWRQLPGRCDLPLRVRRRFTGAVRLGWQPDDRHLEQLDRRQLQRRDVVGERRPLLRLPSEHLDVLLHLGEPIGSQALDLQLIEHLQFAVLLRLQVEDTERQGAPQHLQDGPRELRQLLDEDVWAQRHLLQLRHIPVMVAVQS